MNKREFRLGQGVAIITAQTYYPETHLYYDNSPIQIIEPCVGLGLNIEPKEEGSETERIRVYMDKQQAKAIIKGLKMAMRGLK